MPAQPITLGFSVHTGWASLVAVSGPPDAPQVIDRRRIELIEGPDADAARFVYHLASELDPSAARALVNRTTKTIDRATRAALRAAVAELSDRKLRATSAAIIGTSAAEWPSLADILKSHSAIHTAEGRLYREAIITACRSQKLAVVAVPARALLASVSKSSRLSSDKVEQHVDGMKKLLGAPWGQDQKQAMLAAWLAIASAPAIARGE